MKILNYLPNYFKSFIAGRIDVSYLLNFDFTTACTREYDNNYILKEYIKFLIELHKNTNKDLFFLELSIKDKTFIIKQEHNKDKNSKLICYSSDYIQNSFIKNIRKYDFNNFLGINDFKGIKFDNTYTLLKNNNGFLSVFDGKKKQIFNFNFQKDIYKEQYLFTNNVFKIRKVFAKKLIKEELNKHLIQLKELVNNFLDFKNKQEKSFSEPSRHYSVMKNDDNKVFSYKIEDKTKLIKKKNGKGYEDIKNEIQIENTDEAFQLKLKPEISDFDHKTRFSYYHKGVNGSKYSVSSEELSKVMSKNPDMFVLFNNSPVLNSFFSSFSRWSLEAALIGAIINETDKTIYNSVINKTEKIKCFQCSLYIKNNNDSEFLFDVDVLFTDYFVLSFDFKQYSNGELNKVFDAGFVEYFSREKLKENLKEF